MRHQPTFPPRPKRFAAPSEPSCLQPPKGRSAVIYVLLLIALATI